MKIVVLDGHALDSGDLDWSPIASQGDFAAYDRTPPDLVVERARGAYAVFTNKVTLSREVLAQLPDLRYIGLLSTGCNAVDGTAARELGITVTNVPAYSSASVAQMTFALLLEAAMGVGLHAHSVRSGEWSSNPDFCYRKQDILELSGKRLGIIGFGAIGRETAKIAHAFGMRVIAFRRTPCDMPAYAQAVDLERLYRESDVVTLHCPLNSDSEKMIARASIERMKDGVILINTARGGLIDENAVRQALDTGKIRYYCADVLQEEPPMSGSVLIGAPNCYLTPHIAWLSKDARSRLMTVAADNLRAFLAGKPCNRVN